MALTDNLLKILDHVAYGYSGKLLTLGVQELVLSNGYKKKLKKKLKKKEFFFEFSTNSILKNLGFSSIDTLEYPGMEESDISLDLNKKLPKKYHSKYDFIFDLGFMEHVYNVPEVMKSLNLLLKPKGKIVHFNPCQGSMNHGFYNFQPTFYFSFYKTCNYKNLKIFLIEAKTNSISGGMVTEVRQNINNMNYLTKKGSSTYIASFATKKSNSKFKIPNQEFYENIFNAKKKTNGGLIPKRIYNKIVGRTKKNNHENLIKKSFYI